MNLNQISTIFFDVDGIFTDGSLYYSDKGAKITKFNVHDGIGCMLLKEAGLDLLILTARYSEAIVNRFKDLGINKIFTKVLNKRDFIREYSKTNTINKKEIIMVGDDLQDLFAIDEVGLFFTTPNAVDIVKEKAHYTTKRVGGNGAVREICDLIISSKGTTPVSEFERFIEKGL